MTPPRALRHPTEPAPSPAPTAGNAELETQERVPSRDPREVERERLAALALGMAFARVRGPIDDGAEPTGPAMRIARQLAAEMALRDALERSIRKFSPRQRGQA